MMEKIKNKKGLPPWFKLENYAGFNKLTAVGWYEQLTVRMNIKDCVQHQKNHIEAVLFINAIKNNPIIDTVHDNPFILRDQRLMEILSTSSRPKTSMGVRNVSVIEALMLLRSIGIEKFEYANHYLDEGDRLAKSQEPFPIKYGHEDWFQEALDDLKTKKPTSLLFSVNLEFSDRLLLEQFESQLKLQRKIIQDQLEHSIHDQKYNPENFVKFGVVPYIDLEIWAAMEDKDITYRTYTDAIFSDGDGGEEIVRNTTKRLAQQIMTSNFIDKLAAIAAKEESEKK